MHDSHVTGELKAASSRTHSKAGCARRCKHDVPDGPEYADRWAELSRHVQAFAIGKPRQLMGYRPLLQAGCSWDDALAHAAS